MSEPITDIVIGTSLAPGSDVVVEGGREFARLLGAKVHLVHALAASPSPACREERERRLHAQARRLELQPPLLATVTVAAGPPHRLLLEAGGRPGAMLVVGAREAPGILGKLAGSTAERVAIAASCPVAILRGPLHLPPGRVLVACDGDRGRGADLGPSFELLAALDPQQMALTVALVTVSHLARAMGPAYWTATDRRALAGLGERVARCPGAAGRSLTRQVAVGRPLASIVERSRSLQPDLLLISRQDGTGLRAVYERRRARRLLQLAPGNLLILPAGVKVSRREPVRAMGAAAAL